MTPASERGAQALGRLAQGQDDGMGGGVVARRDLLVGARHERLAEDRRRAVGPFALLQRGARLAEGGAHEELVVHGR